MQCCLLVSATAVVIARVGVGGDGATACATSFVLPLVLALASRVGVFVQRTGSTHICWAEARVKIARMTLTIKLDRNWSSFQLANSAPPLSVTDSAIAPSARMGVHRACTQSADNLNNRCCLWRAPLAVVRAQHAICVRGEGRQGTMRRGRRVLM